MKTVFALVGLNKPSISNGFPSMYATVDLPNEDWFHSQIDMPSDRLDALWKWMTSENETFKGKMCVIEHEGFYEDGLPRCPIVKEIYEVPIQEWNNYFDWSKMKIHRHKL